MFGWFELLGSESEGLCACKAQTCPREARGPQARTEPLQGHPGAPGDQGQGTLHDRTKKAVEAVEHLLEGVQPAADVSGPSETVVASVVPTRIPWSLEGLVVDPGEEAVGVLLG